MIGQRADSSWTIEKGERGGPNGEGRFGPEAEGGIVNAHTGIISPLHWNCR